MAPPFAGAVMGILRIMMAMKIRKGHKIFETKIFGSRWYIPLVLGIALVILGIVRLFNSLVLAVGGGLVIGIAIIASGISPISLVA